MLALVEGRLDVDNFLFQLDFLFVAFGQFFRTMLEAELVVFGSFESFEFALDWRDFRLAFIDLFFVLRA